METEQVVYSVAKEVDFAADAQVGPFAESGLAAIIKAVHAQPQKGAVQVVDFQPYAPSFDTPASFFATPIFNGQHVIGILVIQLSLDTIDQITLEGSGQALDGLGDSGKIYVVGPICGCAPSPARCKPVRKVRRLTAVIQLCSNEPWRRRLIHRLPAPRWQENPAYSR